MVVAIIVVFGALPSTSGIHRIVQRVLQHSSSLHTTNIFVSNLDTFWYYLGE
jgi:hypothetical protein